jgi:hypothetical protein
VPLSLYNKTMSADRALCSGAVKLVGRKSTGTGTQFVNHLEKLCSTYNFLLYRRRLSEYRYCKNYINKTPKVKKPVVYPIPYRTLNLFGQLKNYRYRFLQCCESGMFIPDLTFFCNPDTDPTVFYSGSRFRIPVLQKIGRKINLTSSCRNRS